MSTKTLRKRIALVAVSALGAGLLSVVPVTSANAGLFDATNVTANVTDGVSVASTSNGTAGSVGVLAQSGEGTTQTAVLLSSGAISTFIAADGDATTTPTATVTGGRFVKTSAGTISGTSATSATGTHSAALGLVAQPNSGATSMVISYANSSTADVSVRITVTVVSTSVYNVFSTAYTTAYWGAGAGADTAVTDATSTNYTKATGQTLAGEITLVDAYGNLLTTDNTGLLTATVTSGALVNLGSASAEGATTTDYNAVTGSIIPFNIQQADNDVPWNGTVTFAFNGVVFATKSGVLTGEVAKVTVSSPKIGAVSGANGTAAVISYADSAGNALYPSSGTSAVSSTLNAVVTGISVADYPSDATDAGDIAITCATSGAAKGLQVQHLNASGTVVKSNTWDAGCASAPYSVTASWDKATYAPGSIATLTLSFKDVYGNTANAFDAIGADSAATLMTVTGGPSAAAITPIAATDKPSGVTGAKTYQFVVGTTEGDYVAVIVPTEVKENNALATNISLPYSVKSTSTAVSNADVLKAIVSLIASINKQIAALQKALLRR
jgi:hypothetical protein